MSGFWVLYRSTYITCNEFTYVMHFVCYILKASTGLIPLEGDSVVKIVLYDFSDTCLVASKSMKLRILPQS